MKSFEQFRDFRKARTASFAAHLRQMPPGDKVIFGFLLAVLAITALVGLYALERSFLVMQPAYGGTLREGVIGAPRFVNPLLATSDTDKDLARLTYAGLMGTGKDGALVLVLAESYQISEDGTMYTFIIREGAKFSDGKPVTADDVVFTVEKAQDPVLKSPALANWANIRAEAVNSREVRFTLPKAYGPFLGETSLGILPEHIWGEVSDEEFAFVEEQTEPVGAGPFKVASVIRDNDGAISEYRLEAFGAYALGRPYLSGIQFLFFTDADELADALRGGRIDSAYGVPVENALRAPYSRVFGVFWNSGKNAVWSRIEVRKALSIAVDRDAIIEDILGGYGTPVYGPVPPGLGVAATPAPTLSSTDRIEAAAEVLTDNGWTYDSDARAWKHGKDELDLSMTLETGNVPELRVVAEAVKADWEKLGVPIELKLSSPADLVQNIIRPREYDALLFGMVIGRDRDLFAFWDSSERKDPGLNVALYADKAVDELLADLRAESDTTTADELLAQVDASIAEDYPAAFLYAPDFIYRVPNELSGVIVPSVSDPSDRFASVAWWHLRSEAVWPFLQRSR